MRTLQKIALSGSLLLAAVALHGSLCFWEKPPLLYSRWAMDHESHQLALCIYARGGVSIVNGTVFGLAAPILLAGASLAIAAQKPNRSPE